MKFNKNEIKIYNFLVENYKVLYPSALIVKNGWFEDDLSSDEKLMSLLEGINQSIKDHRPLYNTARLTKDELDVLKKYYISKNGDIKIFPLAD